MVGTHFTLQGASCPTKPVQKPHPPIWIGANADVAIRRAARLGDCWYVNPHNRIDTIVRQVEVYRRALDALGKPFPDEFPCRREVFVAATHEEAMRSEEHTSELQSLMRISYAVFCLKKKNTLHLSTTQNKHTN